MGCQVVCAAVGFSTGVESQNIVGYQDVTITSGYQFFTVTFDNVTNSTAFSLSDIGCYQSSGAAWKDTGAAAQSCKGAIIARKISASGAYGQEYMYYGNTALDEAKMGWFVGERDSTASNKVTGDAVTFAPGEGMIIYCSKSAAKLRVAGSVKLTTFSKAISQGYSFGGNCTPVTINLSDIGCTQASGAAWKDTGAAAQSCKGAIIIRKISSAGAYGQEYMYYGNTALDEAKMGWFVGERDSTASNKVTGDAVTFVPGEGWILYCSKSAAILNIPSPVTE